MMWVDFVARAVADQGINMSFLMAEGGKEARGPGPRRLMLRSALEAR